MNRDSDDIFLTSTNGREESVVRRNSTQRSTEEALRHRDLAVLGSIHEFVASGRDPWPEESKKKLSSISKNGSASIGSASSFKKTSRRPSDAKDDSGSPNKQTRQKKQPTRFSRVKNRSTRHSGESSSFRLSTHNLGDSVASLEKPKQHSNSSLVEEPNVDGQAGSQALSLRETERQETSSRADSASQASASSKQRLRRDPPGRNRSESVLKYYSSSSSLEESAKPADSRSNARRQRVSRRKGQKRAPTRKAKAAPEDLGESFQLSFSEDENKAMGTFAPFENSFEAFDASATIQWKDSSSQQQPEFISTVSSSDTLCTAADIKLQLYTLAQQHKWSEVAMFCRSNPWAAKHVDEEDGTTVLHLAVMSRANPYLRGTSIKPAPLDLIEALVAACPEAAIVRCSLKRYTPLCYVCLVSERDYDLEDACKVVEILLSGAPQCAMVFTEEGYSALDIHIISYSKLHDEKAEMYSTQGRTSTLLLRTLLKLCPALVESRPYGQRTKGPIEILYRCNLKEFKAASGGDTLCAKARGNFCASVASTVCDWWAWKWIQTLLEASWNRSGRDGAGPREFSVVHAAAQIVGCPVAVLCLTMDGFPEQVQQRSRGDAKLNSPLHEVCSWVTDDVIVCGDSFVQKRKSKAIAALLQAFPSAARMTNGLGETPLQLAVETCTPWDGGLGALALTFPKALLIQRSLDHLIDNSPLVAAMSFHDDDLGSVSSDSPDSAIDALQGMYPFLVAAALSHVPENKLRSVTPHTNESAKKTKEQVQTQLNKKELDSLSSVYGLLRAKPQAVSLYIEYIQMAQKIDEGSSASESSTSNSDESTEALSLSDLIGHG